ncbi:MAG: hypothetical protein Q7K43_01490 [Candidatus Woesearchaeota archaeon]|nr:hypothetical protein [Candidatus Woesearchaeota archaeon]
MNKRAASLTVETIIVAALGLIALVLLGLLFKSQITKTSQTLFGIGEDAQNEARGTNKCESFLSARKCLNVCESSPTTSDGRSINWREAIPPPGENWNCVQGKFCCERMEA